MMRLTFLNFLTSNNFFCLTLHNNNNKELINAAQHAENHPTLLTNPQFFLILKILQFSVRLAGKTSRGLCTVYLYIFVCKFVYIQSLVAVNQKVGYLSRIGTTRGQKGALPLQIKHEPH